MTTFVPEEKEALLIPPWTNAMAAVNGYMKGEGIPESIELISNLFTPESIEQDFNEFMKCLKIFLDQVMETAVSKLTGISDDSKFLFKLVETWILFYTKTLPFVQMILSPVDEILELDKIRTLAIQAFSHVVLNENKAKLLEIFAKPIPELTDGMTNAQVTARLNQMLNVAYEALTKRIYVAEESQTLTPDGNTRRQSMADNAKKRKNSVENSRRLSLSKTNSLKGLFKQNSGRVSFAEKSLPKNFLIRKTYAVNSKDVLELKDEFEKNWKVEISSPSIVDLLIARKMKYYSDVGHDPQIAVNSGSEVGSTLQEFNSNDSLKMSITIR